METLSRSGAFIINSQRRLEKEPAERAQKGPQKGFNTFDDEKWHWYMKESAEGSWPITLGTNSNDLKDRFLIIIFLTCIVFYTNCGKRS